MCRYTYFTYGNSVYVHILHFHKGSDADGHWRLKMVLCSRLRKNVPLLVEKQTSSKSNLKTQTKKTVLLYILRVGQWCLVLVSQN